MHPMLRAPCDIAETGDWAEDNRAGRELARDLINHLRETESVPAFGGVMKRMAEFGRWGGVEVGFAAAIASAAL